MSDYSHDISIVELRIYHKQDSKQSKEISGSFDYNNDDLDFETRIDKENKEVLRGLEEKFLNMTDESKNGFKNLKALNQREIILDRKKEIRVTLGFGSFRQKEITSLTKEYFQKIDDIYEPYLKELVE